MTNDYNNSTSCNVNLFVKPGFVPPSTYNPNNVGYATRG